MYKGVVKRTFSTIFSGILKQKSADLKSTLQFLVQAERPTTLTSIFGDGTKLDGRHVKQITELLNKDLPDGKANKRRIDAQYEILMTRLRQLVEVSVKNVVEDKNPSSVGDRIAKCESSEHLYLLLLELQLSRKLTRGLMAKIVMHSRFAHAKQLSENLVAFDHELELATMVWYRLRGSEAQQVRTAYRDRLIASWRSLSALAQKLVWRSEQRAAGRPGVLDLMQKIPNWTPSDTVALYQALYSIAHELPAPADLVCHNATLTANQIVFVETLRALSPWISQHVSMRKKALSVVRASVEDKVALEATENSEVSVFRYRFIRRLDDLVQQAVRDSDEPEQQAAIQRVLTKLHAEQEQIRSQTVLKFI
ncbi:LAMI_0G13740g1_1 [Lachancea mirantina]|uniref:LAMI_0G13740g1_1 n=1 Tax=Lachancea mirantina TaxID=1230905 RepID=A0A1G4KBT3_9SACH|nr:LAMI_0G13740g1_1 [Lachancea mirantina]